MGNILFGIDIAKIVDQNISAGLLDATLHSFTYGDRDPENPGLGIPRVEVSTACKGVLTFYDDKDIDGTLVKRGDRLVLLIGETLGGVVPVEENDVTIEGRRYHVIEVRRDPAAATFSLQVRA